MLPVVYKIYTMSEEDSIQNNLKKQITKFFEKYYDKEIRELPDKDDEKSITVSFALIEEFNEDLAKNLREKPEFWIRTAKKSIEDYDDLNIEYPKILFKDYDYYNPSIRELRDKHIGKLVNISGVVSKTTSTLPKSDVVAFECQRCGGLTKIKQPLDAKLEYPSVCSTDDCNNRTENAFRINVNQSDIINFKKIEIQEPPENTKGGQTPESETFTAKGEIATNVTAGDNVNAIGIYKGAAQGETSILRTYIRGNNIESEDKDEGEIDIEPEEEKKIIELSEDPDIYDKLVKSTAPSMYGLEDEKTAIMLQLFGGIRKTEMDSDIRGDIHVLLVGDPGVGKSISGDTRLVLGDGSILEIQDFVENHMNSPTKDEDGDYVQELEINNIKVMGMDKDGEIEPRTVEAVWKKQVKNSYKLTLEDGRTIETSGTHPLFETDGDAHIDQVKVKDIDEGQFIAVPRSITYDGDLELNIDKSYNKYGKTNIEVPQQWTEELAEFMGLIVGEGQINEEGTISITNQDEELLDIARKGFELFGIDSYQEVWVENSNAYKIKKGCKNLTEFFNDLDDEFINLSADKRIPTCLYSTPENIRKAFIRAYVDGEVHVSLQNRELSVSSISQGLLRDLQQLLDTFGISSRISDKKQDLSYNDTEDYESYRLRIYGDAFRKYVEEIGFYSNRKIEQAELMKDSREDKTNVDVIPNIGSVIKETRELLGMHQSDFSVPRTTVLGIENEGKNPSKKTLQAIVVDMVDRLRVVKEVDYDNEPADMETVDKMRSVLGLTQGKIATDGAGICKGTYRYHLTNNTNKVTERSMELYDYVSDCLDEQYHEAHENLIRLESLAWGDVRWEKVESVEKVDYDDEWMYDLQVEGTHNYIANGIMSHNSQLLRYASKLSPRGIMTNGKGASSAGLCVGPDTHINYNGELVKISDVVQKHIKNPVNTPVASEIDSYSRAYNLDSGKIEDADTTHLWRMPTQNAKKIQTKSGRELVVSEQTPLLLSTENGLEWVDASDITEGDNVSIQDDISTIEFIDDIDMRKFIDFDNELIDLTESKRKEIKKTLTDKYGTLRSACEELGFSEDFVYGTIINRDIMYEKLEIIENNTDFTFDISDIDNVSLRYGKKFTLPSSLDKDLMWLIGMTIGDGNINKDDSDRGVVRISNSSEYVLKRAKSIIKDKFNKDVSIETGIDDRPDYIRFSSKTIRKMFLNIGMAIPPKTEICLDNEVMNHKNISYLIQGYMDADGSIHDRSNEVGSSTVSCSSVSESWIKQLRQILENKFGIHCNYRIRHSKGNKSVTSNGQTIISRHNKHVLEIKGKEINKFVDKIGFSIDEKVTISESVASIPKNNSKIVPVGDVLRNSEGTSSRYHRNMTKGSNPRLKTLNNIIQTVDIDSGTKQIVKEHADSSLIWEEVVNIETVETELYDLTTEHSSFIANGIVTHNTASAVRDAEFGGDDKWTLKAGALVLADKGIACVDELDKMDSSDRSAMHEGLEQQTISVNKAGINATLKSRCTMLAAANPKEGRWNEYDPVAGQIDLEPALISRFDLIFAPTDDQGEDWDQKLSNYILMTNHRGQQLEAGVTPDNESEEVVPDIPIDLYKKYIAYAKKHCTPVLTEEAIEIIQDFFVQIRAEGEQEGAIPVTARKIEGIVRLSEAAARIQLSDTIDEHHAEKAVDIVMKSLYDVGYDEETGRFDVDMTEGEQSTSQRDRKRLLIQAIEDNEDEGDKGAPKDLIIEIMTQVHDFEKQKIEHDLNKLGRDGQEVYEPKKNEYAVM